ncbi:hypothetical protein WA026_020223 [Henosepilachna vigintioctopunctata]|uniref:Ig-like domain-containing protein n=1 Tax=Henosepilachna vigintioctopunctata TaxID=420089 RepID=A0AAW1UDN0_9CUCU
MFKGDLIFYFSCCFLMFISSATALLKIKELKIPASVENGTVTEIILDCDFIAEKETGIVVKWFYNGDKDQIYQWIPGQNKSGSPMGSLKNFIDEKYKASNNESTMYRALKLVNVSQELTGKYTCKVTGDSDESVQTRQMTIFVPPTDGLNLTINQTNLSAICTATGVYPEPHISIKIDKGTNSTDTKISTRETVTKEHNLFDKEIILTYNNESFSSPCEFVCEMRIPGTEYRIIETKKCSLDNFSIQLHANAFLLHSSLLLLFSTMWTISPENRCTENRFQWRTIMTIEPVAPTPKAAAQKGAAPDKAAAEAQAADAAGAEAEAPPEPAPEEEYLDPDKLLLFKHWIRPKFLQYSYLYDYRHNYYNDVIDYLDRKRRGLNAEIPRAQTWAERALRTYSSKIDKIETYRREMAEKMKSLQQEKKTRRSSFISYHSKEYMSRRYTVVMPKFLQYDYLYNYQYNYYDNVLDYLEKRSKGYHVERPSPQTWAERALRTYMKRDNQNYKFRRTLEDTKLITKTQLSGFFHNHHARQSFKKSLIN